MDSECIKHIAALRNRSKIGNLSEEQLTIEMCLEAVREDGMELQYAPEQMKTYEMCLAAVKYCGEALEFVPDNFKSDEMYLEAIK